MRVLLHALAEVFRKAPRERQVTQQLPHHLRGAPQHMETWMLVFSMRKAKIGVHPSLIATAPTTIQLLQCDVSIYGCVH